MAQSALHLKIETATGEGLTAGVLDPVPGLDMHRVRGSRGADGVPVGSTCPPTGAQQLTSLKRLARGRSAHIGPGALLQWRIGANNRRYQCPDRVHQTDSFRSGITCSNNPGPPRQGLIPVVRGAFGGPKSEPEISRSF